MPNNEHVILKAIQPIIILVEKSLNQQNKENVIQTVKNFLSNLDYLNPDLSYKIFCMFFSSKECERYAITESEILDTLKLFDDKINCELDEKFCNISRFIEILNEELSRQKNFSERLPYKIPLIMMLADGNKTYEIEEYSLNDLMRNKWFLYARKIFFSFSNVNWETINLVFKFGFNEAYVITEGKSQKFKDFCEDLIVREIYAHHKLTGLQASMGKECILSLLNPCEANDDDMENNAELDSRINEINSRLQKLILNDDVIDIIDELVKVDPVSDNDLTDGDWLSGDTEWD